MDVVEFIHGVAMSPWVKKLERAFGLLLILGLAIAFAIVAGMKF